MAGSGKQAEAALAEAVDNYSGKYVCVVEGSIPTRDKGIYMKLAGRPAMEVLDDVAGKAAAIIAIGSCASWGGIPSADPDPTGAVGVVDLLPNKTIVNLPGCPPNPYTLLGVVLQFADSGTLPELDDKRRPKFAYDRDIHEHCPRRAHFDAGRFVKQFGDQGHREGWCLYEMGCKGPDTHAGCSTRHFNEIPDVWPIGIGAPCIGCTEKSIAFRVPMFKVVPIHTFAAPPETYAPISAPQGTVSPIATGLVGLAAGALAGAGYVASRKFSQSAGDESVPGSDPPAGGGNTEGSSETGPKESDHESRWLDRVAPRRRDMVCARPAMAQTGEQEPPCMECHKPRDTTIDPVQFARSVHATLDCTACHTEGFDKFPHASSRAAMPDCIDCHSGPVVSPTIDFDEIAAGREGECPRQNGRSGISLHELPLATLLHPGEPHGGCF